MDQDGKNELFMSTENVYDGCIYVGEDYYPNNMTWDGFTSCLGTSYSEDYWISISHGNYSGNLSLFVEDWGSDDKGELFEMYWDGSNYAFRQITPPDSSERWYGRLNYINSMPSCDMDGDGLDELGVSSDHGGVGSGGGGIFIVEWNGTDYVTHEVYVNTSYGEGWYGGSSMDKDEDGLCEYYTMSEVDGSLWEVYWDGSAYTYIVHYLPDSIGSKKGFIVACGNVTNEGMACYQATYESGGDSNIIQWKWNGSDFEVTNILNITELDYTYAIAVGDIDVDGLNELLVGGSGESATTECLNVIDKETGTWTNTQIGCTQAGYNGDVGVYDADKNSVNEVYFGSYVGTTKFWGILKVLNRNTKIMP